MPALINTVIMTGLSLLIAVPLGIFAAIFLVEYAKRGNKFMGVIRLTTETLSGIPSIVYGLFGMLLSEYAGLGIFPAGRCVHFVDHDSSADHASDRRVFEIGSGFLQGGKFRAGSGKTAHRISDHTSVCRTGDLSGRHSGNRADRRRDRGIDVHGGNCGESAVRRDGIRADSRCTYVQSRKRGTLHGSGICDGSGMPVLVVGINTLSGVIAKRLTKA